MYFSYSPFQENTEIFRKFSINYVEPENDLQLKVSQGILAVCQVICAKTKFFFRKKGSKVLFIAVGPLHGMVLKGYQRHHLIHWFQVLKFIHALEAWVTDSYAEFS